MGLLFKKRDVPSELPNLVSDDIGNELAEELANVKKLSEQRETMKNSVTSNSFKDNSSREVIEQSNNSESEGIKKFPSLNEDDDGYFKALMKSVMDETEGKAKSKNNSNVIPKDLVGQMRQYWEKQTPEIIMNNFGGETKSKLFQQIEKLHTLEKEWQNNYINLLSCEDKIRDEEKQLKEALAEFIAVYKRSSKRRYK